MNDKELYEEMDVIADALPEGKREQFADLMDRVTRYQAAERRAVDRTTVRRWRRSHGYEVN